VASARYALEHFYYGQLVRNGKAEGELRLLAASSGLVKDQIAEIVRAAVVPPVMGQPLGSWAIVRGGSIPFILVQSQVTQPTAAMLHFIVIPVDVLRAIGGNLRGMMRLLEQTMPVFDQPDQPLSPIMFPQVGAPTADAQIDSMLALMTATRDRLTMVEMLLAALIEGVPIAVYDAPTDPARRIDFVEGLLALLPPPARVGVTFALHATPATRVDAQLRFLTSGEPPADALVFNWQRAELSGSAPDDDYSHFIVSQLRLDPDLVIQQTNALTAVASWRIRRGDLLAEALSYAAYRLKIDNSLLNNLPVEAEDAVKILNEDPTLNETLRAAYARHVLAFGLALGETTHIEPIGALLREQPELERAALAQLQDALREGKTDAVYELLTLWLSKPLAPDSMAWQELAQNAALQRLGEVTASGDTAEIRRFIHQLRSASFDLDLRRIIARIIEAAKPAMARDPDLALTLFILGAQHLNADQFNDLLRDRALLNELPDNLRRVSSYVTNETAAPAPSGLLARTATGFGSESEMLVLLRLTEAALMSQRYDLIDTNALTLLAAAASTPDGDEHDTVLRWVVQNLSTDELLPTLDDPGPRCLLQILLARRQYTDLARELLRHARVLYSVDKQGDYAVMVRRLFAETPVDADELPGALETLEDAGVKPLPLAMAHLGALKQGNWAATLHPVALNVTALLFDHRSIVEAIPPASVLELLNYHVGRQDVKESIRAAGLVPLVAARKGEGGAALMIQMVQMMNYDQGARVAAQEVLRRYIRLTDISYAPQAVARLRDGLGLEVGRALDVTYRFRLLMQGADIADFAVHLHQVTEFLKAPTMVYVDKRAVPGLKSLLGDLDSLAGGLSEDDREATARALMNLGRAIILLSRTQKDAKIRDLEQHIADISAGKTQPKTALDVLWAMGGYFSRGRRLRAKIEPPEGKHPLGDRTAPSLMREAGLAANMLRGLLKAFPPDESLTLTTADIRAEIESLWGDLPLVERRSLVRDLAIDLQHLPDIILHIAERGDPRVMDEKNRQGRDLDANRVKPESVLEFYRFMNGYFRGKLRG
jgi:hypothetical protein